MRPFEQCIALVVNDDPFQLQLIAGAFRHDNLFVHTCESAVQSLATMRIHGPPDIIVTDLHMPDIDGWQLCWLLRSTICPAHNHIPIMVVSTTHILKEAADIKTLGADDFLAAPCSPAQIRRRARQWLEGSSRTPATAAILVAGTDDGSLAICKSFAKTGYSACHSPSTEVAVNALGRQKMRTRAIIAAETLMKNQAQALKSSECHYT